MAPRDIRPGDSWDEAILGAIDRANALVILISGNANESKHVKRELVYAADRGRPIFPVRIENILPSPKISYPIIATQFTDVWEPPLDGRIKRLAAAIIQISGAHPGSPVPPVAPAPVPASATNLVVAPDHPTDLQPVAARSAIEQGGSYTQTASGSRVSLAFVGTSSRSLKPEQGAYMNSNLAVASGHAYVIANGEGVRIFDISDLQRPKVVSSIHSPHDCLWFEVVGTTGILRGQTGHAELFDVRDPGDPRPISFDNHYNCRFNNCGRALLSRGSIVIDLCWRPDAGVRIFDFANPSNVIDVATIKYPTVSGTLHKEYLVLGNFNEPKIKPVFIADGRAHESRDILLDTEDGPVVPKSITAVGQRLYVIGTRKHQSVIASFDLTEFPGTIHELYVQDFMPNAGPSVLLQTTHSDRWISLTEGGSIILIDLSNPDRPEIACRQLGPYQSATLVGDRVFASDKRNVWIFDISTENSGCDGAS